jgi:hypothetical protein
MFRRIGPKRTPATNPSVRAIKMDCLLRSRAARRAQLVEPGRLPPPLRKFPYRARHSLIRIPRRAVWSGSECVEIGQLPPDLPPDELGKAGIDRDGNCSLNLRRVNVIKFFRANRDTLRRAI